jgi:hypothetical protein
MEKITRDEAKGRGLKFFCSGISCKKGHFPKRYVSSYQCYECSKLKGEKWHKKNRIVALRRMRERYYSNRDIEIKKIKENYRQNVELRRQYARDYRANNIEARRLYDKKKRALISDLLCFMRENHPEILKEFGL